MPHQKTTVLSVCFIYRRSAYLEAIVIQHCRLFTYFSGIVPSYRIRKWVNWYADCLSLKPFQNQLCRWFSVGSCIPFLNVMCCSAWVRWGGCANLTWDGSWFSFWQNFHWIEGKFSLGQVCKLKSSAYTAFSLQTTKATCGRIGACAFPSPPLFTALWFASVSAHFYLKGCKSFS